VARIAGTVLLLCALSAPAGAQSRPFEILDNSFLVEEAFNQEAGIFQSILGANVGEAGDWEAAFTQEWPLFGQRHQLSYTIPYAAVDGRSGVGDLHVHYRWQASVESGRTPAFAPRVSLTLHTGDAASGLGSGSPGWQVNLPFSTQLREVYLHWNAGFTHTPSATIGPAEHNLFTPHAAVSGVWRVRPMVNVLLESVAEWEPRLDADGIMRHEAALTLSPGVRVGKNIGRTQTVLGVAMPVTVDGSATTFGVFGYVSYERPFTRRP
jgi:hypothetical protein